MSVPQLIIIGFCIALIIVILLCVVATTIRAIKEQEREEEERAENMLGYIKQLEKRIETLHHENEFYKHNLECCLNIEFKKLKDYLEDK